MPWRMVAEWAGFQAVWFACAIGAAQELNWPGVAAASVFLTAVLAGRGWARAEIVAVAASGLVGGIAETLLVAAGLLHYAAVPAGLALAPAWIVALWLAFGGTLAALDPLLGGKPLRAAVVGAVAGPLAYLAGARLGAVEFPLGAGLALTALAAAWAFALPLLLDLRRRWAS